MTNKTVEIGNNQRLLNGFNLVCDAVKQTLGAEGKLCVMPGQLEGTLNVTKDGISVAKRIFPEDQHERIGAFLAKEVSLRSLSEAGDSTTTCLVIAQDLISNINHYNKKVEQGIDVAKKEIEEYMNFFSKSTTDKDIKRIAYVSSNNNEDIAEIVSQAYKFAGKNGVIEVRKKDKGLTELITSNGIVLKKGMESPFMTNTDKNRFEAENVVIVCYEGILEGDSHIAEFLQKCKDNKDKNIVIIAEHFSEDVLVRLIDMHTRGILNICAVQAPMFDNKRIALLRDTALYTGGEVFLRGSSTTVKAGRASKVVIDNNSTFIMVEEISQKVKDKVESLKKELETTTDEEFTKTRISNLEGTSATILVGGITPVEIGERYDRVDDAVCAVRTALEEGYICGGGAGLYFISTVMDTKLEKDAQKGYNALKKAIQKPFKQICTNANRDYRDFTNEGSFNFWKRNPLKEYGTGYNATKDKLSDLIEDGIIDSTKSIRIAIENAVSVSKLLLNTNVVISNG